MSKIKDLAKRALDRSSAHRVSELETEVSRLKAAVEENRRLNERLSDVLDVVTELLVPAVDRDDARLQEAIAHLGRVAPSHD